MTIEQTTDTMIRIASFWSSQEATDRIVTAIEAGKILESSDPVGFTIDSQRLLLGIFAHGSPYCVSAPICDVLEVAAASLPDSTLRESDFPTQAGFVRYESPIDLHVAEHLWRKMNTDRSVPMTASPKLLAFAWNVSPEGAVIYVFVELVPRRPVPALLWMTALRSDRSWNEQGHGRPKDAEEIETEPYLKLVLRHFYALILFMQQRITETRPVVIGNRQARKRALDMNGQATVNLITLRRRERKDDDAHDEHSVEWQCRWLVRGHWRKQYYPRTAEHRPKFIQPYVKGPEDKELVVKATAFQVVR